MQAPPDTDRVVSMVAAVPRRRLRPRMTLLLLCLLYIMSFADRGIVSLLVDRLKTDLGISDVQVGFLIGTAFALFYGILSIPAARLADTGDRHRLIVIGAILWSLCTIGSGFVQSFHMLVLLRAGLAIGETCLTPAAYSMIGDLFPPHRRVFAASVYTAAGVVGASGSYIVGGLIVGAIERAFPSGTSGFAVWQMVIIVVGVPSLLLSLLFGVISHEPPREARSAVHPPSLAEATRFMMRHSRVFVLLFVATGITQMIAGSYGAWGPTFMHRVHGWEIRDAALASGLSGIVASIAGTMLTPWITARLQAAGHADAVALVSACGVAIGGLFATAAPLQDAPWAFYGCTMVSFMCLMGAAGNIPISMQFLAPAGMRATLIAYCLISITLIGMGIGPVATAMIGERITSSGGSIGTALSIVSLAVTIFGTALFLFARPGFSRLETPGATDHGRVSHGRR